MKHFTSFLAAMSRVVLATIFWLAVRFFDVVKVHGIEYAKGKAPTYFAMAHKRDLDPMVEVPVILAARGWRALAKDVRFAMRSDAFSYGFLSRIVAQPRWFSRFLRLISVGNIIRHLGIYPLENLHSRPAEEWIRDWIRVEGGNMLASDVLTEAFIEAVAQNSGEDYQKLKQQSLAYLLSWRFQKALQPFCSVDIFATAARARAKNIVLSKLKQQLSSLGAWLSDGGSLWGAPEGQLSPGGAISPITSIPYRLLQAGPPDATVLPIFIVYDYMSMG